MPEGTTASGANVHRIMNHVVMEVLFFCKKDLAALILIIPITGFFPGKGIFQQFLENTGPDTRLQRTFSLKY